MTKQNRTQKELEMKNQETITQENYDKSLELLNEMMDIIKEWELDGRSRYDRYEHKDDGNDDYEKDIDRLEELEDEWVDLSNDIFPLEDHTILQPYNHYEIYDIIEKIEDMKVYRWIGRDTVFDMEDRPIKDKILTLMGHLNSLNLSERNLINYNKDGRTTKSNYNNGLYKGRIDMRNYISSTLTILFLNELDIKEEK